MSILFPSINRSLALEPFAKPLGRMMLAYGRATTAAITLARLECSSEADAVKLVNSGSHGLTERLRHLFRDGKLNPDHFAKMDAAAKRFAELAGHRNNLFMASGEWFTTVEFRSASFGRASLSTPEGLPPRCWNSGRAIWTQSRTNWTRSSIRRSKRARPRHHHSPD